MQRGLGVGGEEVPRGWPCSGMLPRPRHWPGAVGDIPRDWSPSHAQSRPLQQGPCRLRSHPSQLMVSVLFLFFSSVFKKIFCQGEPLGHGRLALGCPVCPAGLAGAVQAGSLGGCGAFQGVLSLWFPQGQFLGCRETEASPSRPGVRAKAT